VRKIFRELLHQYRVESFKITHNNETVEDTTSEILKFTDDALNNAYHYHFHKDEEPDPTRVETFNMIKNYTLESIMPPVLEKVMRRILVLEKQHESIVQLIDNLLEALSEDEGVKNSDRPAV
jgi:hypothetical protein